jgi:hypothetical protein
MRLKLIACEIAVREFEWAIKRSRNTIIAEYLVQGHHNDVVNGRKVIQERIDDADREDVEAILLGYALCNNMLAGIEARRKPLVIARAHDCITWFLGSKERYRTEFDEHPGTYYYTEGWLSVKKPDDQIAHSSSASGIGVSGTYEELVEKYGQDNAQYLWEVANGWVKHYTHGTYIGLPGADHDRWREQVHAICERNGWRYRELDGDPGLLQRWVDGPWDSPEFLMVPPGRRIVPTFDNEILTITTP